MVSILDIPSAKSTMAKKRSGNFDVILGLTVEEKKFLKHRFTNIKKR